jgi:hypothetical protein
MHARFAVLTIAALALAACDRSPTAPAEEVVAFNGSQASIYKNPSGTTVLGGLDVWSYCISEGYPTVGYKRGYIAGPQAAFNNWVCQTGPDQLNPVNTHPINIVAACQWYYNRKAVQAHPDNPDHAWSWKCYASTDK